MLQYAAPVVLGRHTATLAVMDSARQLDQAFECAQRFMLAGMRLSWLIAADVAREIDRVNTIVGRSTVNAWIRALTPAAVEAHARFFCTEAQSRVFADVAVGETFIVKREVTEVGGVYFGRMSGDGNPIHYVEIAGRESFFGEKIAPGLYVASFASAALVEFLGPGIVYRMQNLEFKAPVHYGDIVELVLAVVEKGAEKPFVTLDCSWRVAGDEVLKGQAAAWFPPPGAKYKKRTQ